MKTQAFVSLFVLFMVFAAAGNVLAQEPCSGEPIEVLNSDPCGLEKWIAVEDSVTICQIKCVFDNPEEPGEKCGIDPSWIGGTVQFDEEAELGFNFIPSTVIIAEVTAEAYQTTTCAIAENPKEFDGGLWYVHFDIRDIK
jgi:hypothetical protein